MSKVDRDLAREAAIRGRLLHLGFPNPKCEVCGEDRVWRLEADHVAGRKHDGTVRLLCANHHADRAFLQGLEPLGGENPKNVFEVIGRWLLGITEWFELIIDKLWDFGEFLIDLARQGYGRELAFPKIG